MLVKTYQYMLVKTGKVREYMLGKTGKVSEFILGKTGKKCSNWEISKYPWKYI